MRTPLFFAGLLACVTTAVAAPIYGTADTCELYAEGSISRAVIAPNGERILVSATQDQGDCGIAYMMEDAATGGGQFVLEIEASCVGERPLVLVYRCPQ